MAAGTSSGWKLWRLVEIAVGGATCEDGRVASVKVDGFVRDRCMIRQRGDEHNTYI